MPTFQDLHIFVTGVVGRAMGSGKFEPDAIPVLCEAAYNAFKLTFGEPDSVPRVAQRPLDAMPRVSEVFPPPAAAPAKSYGAPVAQEPGAVEGKHFRVWANDKLKLGKDKQGPAGKPWAETTWAEAHQGLAGRSPEKVVKWLEFLTKIEDKDPKWASANATLRARAQALLDTFQQPDPGVETPF